MPSIPVYSYVLLANTGFMGTATLDVPAGSVVVVRDIDAVVGITAGGTIWAYDTNGVQFWGYTFGATLFGKFTASWRGRQVIPGPGTFSITTDYSADFRASGYILSQP